MQKDTNSLGNLLGVYRFRVQGEKLTQKQLGQHVGVSSTTIRKWENSSSIPNAHHLKKLIAVYFRYGVFEKGREREEIEDLWRKASLSVAFDEKWFYALITSGTPNLPEKHNQIFSFNIPLADPKELCGRVRERITLLDRTTKGGSTSIRGPRRIGKTWLMSYLIQVASKELDSRFHTVYLDATQAICATVSGFVVSVLERLGISDHASADLIKLERTIVDLGKQDRKVVLCIDKFEGFSNQQEFDYQFFASLRAMTSQGLVLVVASKMRLKDFIGESGRSSGFFNIFEDLPLDAFDLNEASEFIQTKAKEADLSQQEQEFLLRYGQEDGKWPPLRLQLVGKLLLEDKILSHKDPQFHYALEDLEYLRRFEQKFMDKYPGDISK